MENTVFCDSHAHMAEPGFGADYPDLDSAEVIVTCTAKPDEWEAQSSIADPRAVKCYGVHPWYADQWDDETRGCLISILERETGAHVGEIGLDSKRGTVASQTDAFRGQLEIAGDMDRVATVHMIGTEKEVLDTIRSLKADGPGIVLHSYGSDSYVKPFAAEGCYFSISPRILSRSDVRVSRLLGAVPEDRLLLETDAPHSGRGFEGMVPFAARLAGLLGTDAGTLLGTAADNLRRLIG